MNSTWREHLEYLFAGANPNSTRAAVEYKATIVPERCVSLRETEREEERESLGEKERQDERRSYAYRYMCGVREKKSSCDR